MLLDLETQCFALLSSIIVNEFGLGKAHTNNTAVIPVVGSTFKTINIQYVTLRFFFFFWAGHESLMTVFLPLCGSVGRL